MNNTDGNDQAGAIRRNADEVAQRVLDALASSPPQVPDVPMREGISQNKVRCIIALVCNRLGTSPYGQPVPEKDTTYQWAGGLINIRNRANDERPSTQGVHWTNVLFSVAERLRDEAKRRPVVYLLSSWHPTKKNAATRLGCSGIDYLRGDSRNSAPWETGSAADNDLRSRKQDQGAA
jgi:hypothetical protein